MGVRSGVGFEDADAAVVEAEDIAIAAEASNAYAFL